MGIKGKYFKKFVVFSHCLTSKAMLMHDFDEKNEWEMRHVGCTTGLYTPQLEVGS